MDRTLDMERHKDWTEIQALEYINALLMRLAPMTEAAQAQLWVQDRLNYLCELEHELRKVLNSRKSFAEIAAEKLKGMRRG